MSLLTTEGRGDGLTWILVSRSYLMFSDVRQAYLQTTMGWLDLLHMADMRIAQIDRMELGE